MTTSRKKKDPDEKIIEAEVIPEVEPPKEEEKPTEPEKPVEPPPATQPQAALPAAIPLNPDGTINARNNSEVLRYCGALLKGKGVPERFDTPEKLFAALMFARDLKLPDTAIRQIANIHGVTSLFGDLPLALVQRSGKMSHFKEQWFDKDYNIICFENKNLTHEAWGCVSWMAREGGEVQSFSFTLDDAKKAGLYPCSNPLKPWAKYTAQMLRYRSRAIGLKSVFADIMNGVSIAEYDFHSNPELEVGLRDVTPKEAVKGKISDLQEALKQHGEDNGQAQD